ncbi:hypothetical protein ANN_07583 [Periplaneta americana]|uniref:Uncharacterized protein n=1 Tax=Periplaneta americana TaxID=6978 RepID=A0ABQ8T069_PERAM|nr:hypothetical protein ANN_07583 [Periplaneta americana]
MSPGSSTESYPEFANIELRESPGKNLNQVPCPDRESNPGNLVSRLDALTVTPQVWTFYVLELQTDMPMERGHYYEKYSKVDLQAAVGSVLKDRWSTYKASKKYNVPFNNLKRFLYAFSGPDDVVIPKKRRPLALIVEEEQKLVTYVIKMQELGGTSRVLSVASLHWLKMDVPIPAPAECEVRSVIKFLNAQGIAPIEIDRQLCQVYGKHLETSSLVEKTPRGTSFFGDTYIKDIVYKTIVADLEDLRRRIVAACATVTPEMLRNTWQELEYRLDICRATRGAHIEVY